MATHPAVRLLFAVLVGVAGAWLAVVAWGETTGNLRLAVVSASFRPAVDGRTRVGIPPFGSISANTHEGPLKLDAEVEQVHIRRAVRWIQQHKTREETATALMAELHQFSTKMIKRNLALAAAGAAIASLLLAAGWRCKIAGILVGVLSVAIPIAVMARTYDTTAFRSPKYEGEVSRAPYLLDTAQQAWQRYPELSEQMPRIADRLTGLYRQMERANGDQPESEERYTRVLLISDLHNNPLAVRFALDLAQSYRVKLVLAAGDFTDLGHPLEADLLAAWREFTVPVVAVTGNHDSPVVAQTLQAMPRVTVLDNGESLTIAGLRIVGFGDPAAREAGEGSVESTPAELRALARRIREHLDKTTKPDIVMVHNYRAAAMVAGSAPVIATGHSHAASVKDSKGGFVINPGTTGAAGVRYLTARKSPPNTAAVLYFSREEDSSRLRVVDMIELEQPTGDFAITRRNIPAPEVPAAEPGL